MTSAQDSLIDEVRAWFGNRAVVTDSTDIEPWLTDWRGRHGQSAAILQPQSTQEASLIVAKAADLGVALLPQGGIHRWSAARPSGGRLRADPLAEAHEPCPPDRPRLDARGGGSGRDPPDARSGGCRGLRFPLTLGAKGSATVGGLISTNAGGTQVLRFGTMRGLVDGLEAVLPDGTIHDGLSGLKKDSRGYSLDQLLIGAEGTLGIVTAARLRLFPAIHSRAVAWLG